MTSFVTRRIALPLALLLGAFAGVGTSYAQDPGPELGDEFILFVNGPNVLVPEFQGEVVNDPLDAASGNKVAKFNHGDFNLSGFRWVRTEGVDLTPNLADGDNLYLSLLSDPANAGQPNVTITLTDKSDDSGANDGTADLEFRLQWVIPQELHDGMWHDLVIPLPPTTWQELEDAKTAGTLDPAAENWIYGGSWSVGGFPIALDGMGPNTAQAPELWQEFEWTNVSVLGVFWDHNTGTGGPIYLDNVYIGSETTDISEAQDPPAAMSGISFSPDGDANLISWTDDPTIGGYNVYASSAPIDDVKADGVVLLQTVPFNAESFEVRHQFEVPHASLAPLPAFYAVTSLSAFGVENDDVSSSAGEVQNPNLPISPSIVQLTPEESDILFDNLSTGNVSGEGFPEGTRPFLVGPSHAKLGDTGGPIPEPDDLSAKMWLGYTDNNELFIYTEVTDDALVFGGPNVTGADTWQFDSIELGWGNYDVRLIDGGSILTGSPHQDMQRGEAADYQFRISAFADATGAIVNTSTFIGWSLDAEVQGGGTAADVLTDDAGNTIGYKTLSLVPLDAIQNVDEGDAVLPPPGADDLRLIPFNISLNDADVPNDQGGPPRETQIQWSVKNNADGQWWNTPAQWQVVALAGRNLFTATDVEPVAGELPGRFDLAQNYPNPFNPATTIRFSLATPEQVTLRVFNMLGQEVTTLLLGERMAAGTYDVSFDARTLASGMYLYRLEAGASFVQTKRMLLLK